MIFTKCPHDHNFIIVIIIIIIMVLSHCLVLSFFLGQVAETKNPGVLTLLRKSDRKLVFIPVMFVLLRMWGTIHFFVSFIMPSSHLYCVKMKLYVVFTVLGILQVSKHFSNEGRDFKKLHLEISGLEESPIVVYRSSPTTEKVSFLYHLKSYF